METTQRGRVAMWRDESCSQGVWRGAASDFPFRIISHTPIFYNLGIARRITHENGRPFVNKSLFSNVL